MSAVRPNVEVLDAAEVARRAPRWTTSVEAQARRAGVPARDVMPYLESVLFDATRGRLQGVVAAAEDARGLIGLAALQEFSPGRPCLTALSVRASARGQGIGAALARAAVQAALGWPRKPGRPAALEVSELSRDGKARLVSALAAAARAEGVRLVPSRADKALFAEAAAGAEAEIGEATAAPRGP